jgi:NAD(P)-dependent dehydrogenase (short-subunit alcohol dehydrogenase family)
VGVLQVGPVHQPEKRLKDVDAAWAVRNFQVNALAPLLLAQAVIEADALNRERWTCLVNLSAKVGSISDNRVGSWYSYRMSKAAQNMANKCVSIELKRLKRKTLCVGIHPGTVATPLSKPFTQNYANEIFSVDTASTKIMTVIANLDPELHCGHLLNWDGSVLQP